MKSASLRWLVLAVAGLLLALNVYALVQRGPTITAGEAAKQSGSQPSGSHDGPADSQTEAPTGSAKLESPVASKPSQPPAVAPKQGKSEGPPEVGDYLYKVKITTDGQVREREDTVSVKKGNSNPGTDETRLFIESPEFDGANIELSWRPDSVLLLGIQDSGSGMSCNLEPDVLVLKLPLKVGETWSWDSSCELKTPQGSGKLNLKGSSKVLGTDVVDVGGAKLPTFVIESSDEVTATQGVQSFVTSEKSKTHFAPSVGMDVLTDSTSTASFGAQTETTRRETRLKDVRPRPPA